MNQSLQNQILFNLWIAELLDLKKTFNNKFQPTTYS